MLHAITDAVSAIYGRVNQYGWICYVWVSHIGNRLLFITKITRAKITSFGKGFVVIYLGYIFKFGF